MAGEGKKIGLVSSVTEMPEVIIGGSITESKFVRISLATLEQFIASKVAAKKNGITITGIVGNTITHPDIVDKEILVIVIDDTTRNTKFEKGNENDIESDSVVLTDNFQLTADMVVSLMFK